MKKWESTFNDNHLRLMRVHSGFVVFYLLLVIGYTCIAYRSNTMTFLQAILFCSLFFSPVILLHGLLAIGAKNKVEISRKVSEIVFAFFIIGISNWYDFIHVIFLAKNHLESTRIIV